MPSSCRALDDVELLLTVFGTAVAVLHNGPSERRKQGLRPRLAGSPLTPWKCQLSQHFGGKASDRHQCRVAEDHSTERAPRPEGPLVCTHAVFSPSVLGTFPSSVGG